ncbi:MAG: hypothetical protein HY825_13665 [Acidobacteria bacterium]|nr:hypothetical protein [Acidobacteriota bacterium]
MSEPMTMATATAALEEANRKLVGELIGTGDASTATREGLLRAMLAVVAAGLAALVAAPSEAP